MTSYTTDDQYPEGGNFKAGDICECTNPEFPVKSWVYSGREWVPNSPASITNPASGLSIKSIWTGTQAQYDAIAVKDANTQYNIVAA